MQVRVNALETPWAVDDLAAVPVGVAIRLTKTGAPADVSAALERAGGSHPVHALLETAAGIEGAAEIARHPNVCSLALGEADLRAELGVTDEQAMNWLRVRVVVAARAAGLPAPMMSAYPHVSDLDGLAASCAAGRALGMHGRTAIHPWQLPVIAAAFDPTEDELRWAVDVLAALGTPATGVAVLPDGAMVDEAMARRARALLGRAGATRHRPVGG